MRQGREQRDRGGRVLIASDGGRAGGKGAWQQIRDRQSGAQNRKNKQMQQVTHRNGCKGRCVEKKRFRIKSIGCSVRGVKRELVCRSWRKGMSINDGLTRARSRTDVEKMLRLRQLYIKDGNCTETPKRLKMRKHAARGKKHKERVSRYRRRKR